MIKLIKTLNLAVGKVARNIPAITTKNTKKKAKIYSRDHYEWGI